MMSRINAKINTRRHLIGALTVLALVFATSAHAAKKQGQITYEVSPTDAKKPSTETSDADFETPSGARQAPSGSSPVLPKVAYPGDLSAFFGATSSTSPKAEVTPAPKPRPATRRSDGDGGSRRSTAYGERRSRARGRRPSSPASSSPQTSDTSSTSSNTNHRSGDNPYLDTAASSSVGVKVISQVLPGYNAPSGVTAAKFMETQAELTYEGAGFARDEPTKLGGSRDQEEHPDANQATEEHLTYAPPPEKRGSNSHVPIKVKSHHQQQQYHDATTLSELANMVTSSPFLRQNFYSGALAGQESHGQRVVQLAASSNNNYRPMGVQESQMNYKSPPFSRDNLMQSESSNMGRGPAPSHFGIPIQIPPTYSFYPTLGTKGYYVTQESAPGTFVQTDRRQDRGANAFIRYDSVPDHVFTRIKRDADEKKVKISKTSPKKKTSPTTGSTKSVKLSLSKFLDKHSRSTLNAKKSSSKTSASAIPSHLLKLSKSDSKMQGESSEFLPSFGSYPFFGSDDGGINIESSQADHSGFGLYNLNGESQGSRSGHTYGARPRKRGRGHRGPAYRASESRSFGYGLLGSGNFEVVRGGIFSDNRPSASRVPMHHGAESYGSGYDYDDVDDEPILGFQGYNNFGSLHNALASKKRITAVVPSDRRSDHSSSSSQLIETTADLDAVD